MLINDNQYLSVIETIKAEIAESQYKAVLQVNKEMTLLYYNIGRIINDHKIWGNKFIDNLAKDIKLAYPNSTGYSVRNLKYMAKFAAEFHDEEFVQEVLAQITWYHNITLMDKVRDSGKYVWYAKETIKTVGQETFFYIRLRAACTNGKRYQIRFRTLRIFCLRRRVNSQNRR